MWIVQDFVAMFLYFVVDVIGCTVARLILPVVSLGRIRVAAYSYDEGEYGWLGGRPDSFGRLELGAGVASGIGLVICALYLAAVLWFVG
ncbi:hypothetical protein AAFG07_14555 [Bradyrhizobium sp. B097]|uniref:hypothetical protein n=1 Tax=Bradyrhizobium sp. B097 TaxID=3140244 RepID=UPI003182BD55